MNFKKSVNYCLAFNYCSRGIVVGQNCLIPSVHWHEDKIFSERIKVRL